MKFKELIKNKFTRRCIRQRYIQSILLAGGLSSGKTFVTSQAFAGTGLRVINSDRAFENAMKKAGLSLKMLDSEQEVRDMVRARAKQPLKMLDLSLDGRLGIIVDGTADKLEKITSLKNTFEHMGYDCYMIFVNTSLDVALREMHKENEVCRSIQRLILENCQANIGQFQRIFSGNNFIIVDNNKSAQELVTQTLNRVSKIVAEYMRRQLKITLLKNG